MMLEVVTLTRHDRPAWLAECQQSVAAQLPHDARHRIIECHSNFQARRWAASREAEFVAWVDDDDRICNRSLQACLDALKETGAAIAVTYEARIDASGQRINDTCKPLMLRDVAMHPRSLHHLAMIRSDCLALEVYEHACQIGIGIDWLMRAWCALKHSAVQVPVVGYEWRQHEGNTSRSIEWADAYERAMPALRSVTNSWLKSDAPVDRFIPR